MGAVKATRKNNILQGDFKYEKNNQKISRVNVRGSDAVCGGSVGFSE
jgi:hypothetical protein